MPFQEVCVHSIKTLRNGSDLNHIFLACVCVCAHFLFYKVGNAGRLQFEFEVSFFVPGDVGRALQTLIARAIATQIDLVAYKYSRSTLRCLRQMKVVSVEI
jgi:hypothetical protein